MRYPMRMCVCLGLGCYGLLVSRIGGDLQKFTLGFERQCTDNVKPKFFIFRAWDIGQCRKIIPTEISCVLRITSCVCTAGKCTAHRLDRIAEVKQGKEDRQSRRR